VPAVCLAVRGPVVAKRRCIRDKPLSAGRRVRYWRESLPAVAGEMPGKVLNARCRILVDL